MTCGFSLYFEMISLIFKFNISLVKILTGFFEEIGKLILKLNGNSRSLQ
jgi:hypothetical protein